MKGPIKFVRQLLSNYKALRIKDPDAKEPMTLVSKKPSPVEISEKSPGFDQLTHTGQV
jgi:hypothetical protein